MLVGSTGVIGMQLPMDRVKSGIKMLAEAKNSSKEKGTEAAKCDHDNGYKEERSGSYL